MKDLGFNEFGELQNASSYGLDEESKKMKSANTSIEMTQVVGGTMNPYVNDDPDGEEEAENTEIAIWDNFNFP